MYRKLSNECLFSVIAPSTMIETIDLAFGNVFEVLRYMLFSVIVIINMCLYVIINNAPQQSYNEEFNWRIQYMIMCACMY